MHNPKCTPQLQNFASQVLVPIRHARRQRARHTAVAHTRSSGKHTHTRALLAMRGALDARSGANCATSTSYASSAAPALRRARSARRRAVTSACAGVGAGIFVCSLRAMFFRVERARKEAACDSQTPRPVLWPRSARRRPHVVAIATSRAAAADGRALHRARLARLAARCV